MSDEMTNLSLNTLLQKLDGKADVNHTHTFVGSIESALSLQGVPYSSFVRNDIRSQEIKAYFDTASFGVTATNTSIKLKAENNRAKLEVTNTNLETANLTISGENNSDITVKVLGQLLINDTRVLTINDKDQITGVDFSDLDIAGRGILVDYNEPVDVEDGVIWGQVLDTDLVTDSTTAGTNYLYSVPIGGIIKTLSNTIPNGYVKADGRYLLRNVYAPLWTFCKTKSQLITDEAWENLYATNPEVQRYSYGDGNLTFRVPNLPTNDDTTWIIKAYDELTLKDVINLSALEDSIKDVKDNIVTTGIGYIKYPDGTLIQYGTGVGVCYFSTAFIDTNYSITCNYEGTSTETMNVSIGNKFTNRCDISVYNTAKIILSSAKVNYIAIGRWKA